MRARCSLAPLALLLALLGASCGWHAGLELPPGANDLGLEYFDNLTPEPDLEAELALELSDFLVSHLEAPLVSPERADVVVRGKLLRFRRRGGARSRENELLEAAVRVDATAELVQRSSGAVLARSTSGIWSSFTTESAFGESEARQRALRHVAEALLLELLAQASLEMPVAEEPTGESLDQLLP